MPIIDSSDLRWPTPSTRPAFDICIIGSGPAGITLARELSGTNLQVVLLESGGLRRQSDTDQLNEIESIGWPRRSDQWAVRNRVLGGSSSTWAGRCAPFDEIDFERRDWVAHSGWPFTRASLEPYFERAATYLGLHAGTPAGPDGWWGSPSGLFKDESGLEPFVWQYSRDDRSPDEPMRFGRHTAHLLGPNVTVVTNATVVAVRADRTSATADGVDVARRDGSRISVRASKILLCAGGVENARLLLASRLGNDLVGRFLMDHPRGPVATFESRHAPVLMQRFGYFRAGTRNQALYLRGFRLSPRVQRAERLLNCAGWIVAELDSDDPWAAMRRLRKPGGGKGHDVRAVISHAPMIARGLTGRLVQRHPVPHLVSALRMEAMVEQQPDRDSRVLLSDRVDRFGVPLSRVDWRLHAEEASALRRTAELAAERLDQLGLPRPALEEWVRDRAMPPRSFTDISHPTGTTRMSGSADAGVVDEHCQVHGVRNLFVSGSSVFPTAGHANPTQTIVAMALRLADHIQELPADRRREVAHA